MDGHTARHAQVSLIYEGVNISRDIAPFLISFTYTDNAKDKADDISLTLEDRGRLWCADWFPTKGDKIRASIVVHNWEAESRTESLPCGTFEVDPLFERSGQVETSDLEFLSGLCRDYGIAVKVTDTQLVCYDEEEYEAHSSVGELSSEPSRCQRPAKSRPIP